MVWQRAGSVSVQNGSNTVTGTGVDFAATSRNGDSFIGPDGFTYEVANVASSTVISILPAYKGPSLSGGAYAIMPVQGYDKMLSDAFNNLNNQFGPKLAALGTTGNYDVLPLEKGGTAATTAATARTNLGLGTAATAATGTAAGNVMLVGAGGLLGVAIGLPVSSALSLVQKTQFSTTSGNPDVPAAAPYSTLITIKYPEGYRQSELAANIIDGQLFSRVTLSNGATSPWRKIYDDNNTTRAADGTLKAV